MLLRRVGDFGEIREDFRKRIRALDRPEIDQPLVNEEIALPLQREHRSASLVPEEVIAEKVLEQIGAVFGDNGDLGEKIRAGSFRVKREADLRHPPDRRDDRTRAVFVKRRPGGKSELARGVLEETPDFIHSYDFPFSIVIHSFWVTNEFP